MATILCRRGWMNFKGLPVLAMRFQCKSISSSSNGDELTSVNHANVDCSHDVNHTASVIRDCSPTALLGIKRVRRVTGSLSDVVKRQLTSDAEIKSFPFHNPINSVDKYFFQSTKSDVEVIVEVNAKQHWLTFSNNALTFEDGPTDSSRWMIHTYIPVCIPPILIVNTPVVLVPRNNALALNTTTENDEITMVNFSLKKGVIIDLKGVFFKVTGVQDPDIFHIQNALTGEYLGVNTSSTPLEPQMFPDPQLIRLANSDGNSVAIP